MVKQLTNPHILLDIAIILFMMVCWFILAISLNKDNIEEYY